MLQLERFLPGFNHILCGNPPKSALAQLKEKACSLRESTLSELSDVFADWISEQSLAPKSEKAHSRQRTYSLAVTFWGFLSQVLSPGTPCSEAVRKVQSYCCSKRLPVPSSETTAFCKARKKLPEQDLESVHKGVCGKLQGRVRQSQLWKGHEVKVIDGTGIALEDTPSNQEAFPQPSTQRAGCGFPVLKLVACFCLSSGALLKWVETSLKSHESRILRSFLDFFSTNDVVLTDRGFSSYSNLALLVGQGVNAVMRVHQARKLDYRKGRVLGPHHRLVTWKRPQRQKGWKEEEWNALPEELQLRVVRVFIDVKGYRARHYDLVTTLLDAEAYTVEDLAELYYRRWAVELYFRHIKTTMGMERLRCKTPEMLRKEMRMFFIAYNLIRGLMQEAAELYDKDLDRLSFKASADTLRQFRACFAATRGKPRAQRRIFDEMLLIVASEVVPLRLNRSEPRALKRRPKPFQRLTKPRGVFKVSSSRREYVPKTKKTPSKAA